MKAIFDIKKIFFQSVNLIKQIDGRYIYIALVTTILSSIIPVISLKIMQQIINLIQVKIESLSSILHLIILYLLVELILIGIQFFYGYYKQKYSLKFNIKIKKLVLEKSSKLDLRSFEDSKVYDMLQRADSQSEGTILTYFDTIISTVGIFISGIGYIMVVISFKPWIILILTLFPMIEFFINNRINREEFKIVKGRTNDERKAWYNSYIITCGLNYKELKLYGLFGYFINNFITLAKKFAIQDLYIGKKRIRYMFIFTLFEQIVTGFLFAYTIYYGYLGKILIGDVVTYTRSIVSAKTQIQQAIQMIANINKSTLFISQLFEFLDLNEEFDTGVQVINEINTIEIYNLSYKYPNCNDYALKNINLTLKKGDIIAIVGKNGSGKSTFMKILLGMYDDYEGEIFINGINFRKINKKKFFKAVGALFQDFTKYEGTIRENICYSNLNKIKNDKIIKDICKKFKLDELVNNQEKNIDAQLGYWFESGKQISLGQWQKIALARCFVRDADLYFLDEPNAMLDAISEFEISELYEYLFKGKIGIIITHKFVNFINKTNRIIVFNRGEIENCGSHEHLLKKSKIYNELYHLQ